MRPLGAPWWNGSVAIESGGEVAVTRPVRLGRWVAAGVGVVLAALAVILSSRYNRSRDGWEIQSGSNELMLAMVLVLGAVLALSFALLRPGPRNPHGARLISIVWTLAIFVALIFTWQVIATADRWVGEVGTTITSPQAYDDFVAAHPESFAPYEYRILTGVYLQSFEFLSSNNVEMSGFVWQKYGPDIPDSVRRGIALPEQLEDAYEPTEAWRVEQNGVEEIGWYFSGTFRQNFDYSLYPFDRQDIWLRLWPSEPVEGVLLVPDFAAYRDLAPETLPGLDTGFVYGGWYPLHSHFSYDLLDYNTDFGLNYGFSDAPDPELFYNLTVARDAFDPLVEHLVLETAIAILLFFLLVLMANESETQQRLGLTVFDLIVASGGLLFAVILDHNAMRNEIESQQLTYLEYFPLILSVFIVLVVLSAVLRVKQWRIPVLGYTGDLVPVLVYWPALLGTLLVVTLLVFFF
jgi:hypothetical protein